MEWFTICRNNGQRKRLFYTWFFTGSLLHCYLKHIIKRCHRHVYRALPQTCCVVWHWIKDDEMTRRSEVCSIIIFGNEQEWGVRLDGAIQRERERKPDEGPTEWASHYLNSLQILNAKGGDLHILLWKQWHDGNKSARGETGRRERDRTRNGSGEVRCD